MLTRGIRTRIRSDRRRDDPLDAADSEMLDVVEIVQLMLEKQNRTLHRQQTPTLLAGLGHIADQRVIAPGIAREMPRIHGRLGGNMEIVELESDYYKFVL